MHARALFFTLAVATSVGASGCDVLQDIIDEARRRPPTPPVPPPPQPCTAIGCADQISVTVRPRAGTFPAGVHVVEVATPELIPTRTCKFVVPPAMPLAAGAPAPGAGATSPAPPALVPPPGPVAPPGEVIQGDCSPGLTLFITAEQRCTTVMRGGAVGQSCEPIPGRFVERLTVSGTPARLYLRQQVDGRVLLERELAPQYRDTFPNGPQCGPACRQATIEDLEL